MSTAVESLVFDLDFKWDKKGFSNFNKSLKSSIAGFAKLGTAVVAMQTASFLQAKGIAEQVDGLEKLSRRIGVTTQQYQQLVFSANDFGASASDVESSLKALTKAQEDVLRGKGDLEAFGRLGVNPADFDNSADLLLAISDSIKNIQSDSEKINLLNRIGVSENLLQSLVGGSDSLKSLGKEFASLGGLITKDQAETAGEFQGVWLRTTTVINSFARKVGTDSLKTINKFLATFVNFAKNNVKEITDGFNKFFRAVSKASAFLFEVLTRIFNVISGITQLIGGFENAVIALSIAFVILKRRMLLAFAIPLVIATALFLVIEDIVKGLQGKDSFFGDLIPKLAKLKPIFDGVKMVINGITDGIAFLVKAVHDLVVAFDGLFKNGFFSAVNDLYSSVTNSLSGLFGGVSTVGQSSNSTISNVTNNGGAVSNNVNIVVNGADGDVVGQLNTYFQQKSNSIYGK